MKIMQRNNTYKALSPNTLSKWYSEIPAFGICQIPCLACMLTSAHPDSETIIYGSVTSFSKPTPYLLPLPPSPPVFQILIIMSDRKP